MQRFRLTVNESKTLVRLSPEATFDFLGYTIGRCYSPKTGRAYLGTKPSQQRVQRIKRTISQATRRSQTQRDAETIAVSLNRLTIGWANYFAPPRSCHQSLPER